MSDLKLDQREYTVLAQRFDALKPSTQAALNDLARQRGFASGVKQMWKLFRDNGLFSLLQKTFYGFNREFKEALHSLRSAFGSREEAQQVLMIDPSLSPKEQAASVRSQEILWDVMQAEMSLQKQHSTKSEADVVEPEQITRR